MVEITTMRIWIAVTLVWPLFWILVFDRWFFWTPLGLLIAIGIPLAGWALWWKFYRIEGRDIEADSNLLLNKGAETLLKLKNSKR